MNSGLRKAHKYIWLLLIVIVPVIVFFFVKNLDVFASENSVSSFTTSKKTSIKSFENEIIKVSFHDNTMEIILKSSLKNSSSIVYTVDEKGDKEDVIGQLTTAGIYNFNVNALPKGIIIYDALKAIEITKLSFKWD